MAKVTRNEIIDSIESFTKTLGSGEDRERFRFLALTCKPELPFRDQLAYYLRRKFTGRAYIGREVTLSTRCTADLAIFPNNKKIINNAILVELKAACSFDIEKAANGKSQLDDFSETLRQQLARWKGYRRIGVFLVTHLSALDIKNNKEGKKTIKRLKKIVKYLNFYVSGSYYRKINRDNKYCSECIRESRRSLSVDLGTEVIELAGRSHDFRITLYVFII